MTSSTRRIFVRAALSLIAALGVGATAPRAEAQLHGIDVSHYQGTVNWTSVKSAGNSFAVAKATEGTTYTDLGPGLFRSIGHRAIDAHARASPDSRGDRSSRRRPV